MKRRQFTYAAYGLRIVSDLPLPGVLRSSFRSEPHLEIREGTLVPGRSRARPSLPEPFYVSPDHDEQGEPTSRAWALDGGAFFRIEYSDRTEFVVNGAGRRVWAAWPESSTLDDMATYLLGPILGFVLGLQGTHSLHASVVAVEGKAIALLGPGGAGKSTTAAALARRGYPVLSDDVAPILERDGRFLIQPAYPRLRLWPESVQALYGSAEALPRITPTWEKRHLDLTGNGYRFQAIPLPLSAIYAFGPRSLELTAPRIESLAGQDALLALISNSYAAHLLGPTFRKSEFDLFSRLLRPTRLRRVIPHEEPGRIAQLCDAIVDDFAGRGAALTDPLITRKRRRRCIASLTTAR